MIIHIMQSIVNNIWMPSQGKGEGGKADLLNIIIYMYHL